MKKQTTLFEGDERDLALAMPPCEHDLHKEAKRALRGGVVPHCYACLVCMRNDVFEQRPCFVPGVCPIKTTSIKVERFRTRGAISRARVKWRERLLRIESTQAEEAERRKRELQELKESRTSST